MVSPSKVFNGVMMIGLTCLALLVAVSIANALYPIPTAQQLIATLDRAFMLCLGAVLALMSERRR